MTRYDVEPCAKVRQTQSDKWKQRTRVMRYRAFADRCRDLKMQVKDNDSVTFYHKMPKSWSEKKRCQMDGTIKRSKPDLDNLLGGLMDAVMPEGDAELGELSGLRKRWARTPGIEITSPYAQPRPYVSGCPAEPQSEPPSP